MRLVGDLNSLALYGTTAAPVPGSTLPAGAEDPNCTSRRAMTARQRSAGRGEPRELKLHRVDLCQVAAGVVVAASLAASAPEGAARVCVAGLAPAQVDDRREVLPLLQRGGGDAATSKAIDMAILLRPRVRATVRSSGAAVISTACPGTGRDVLWHRGRRADRPDGTRGRRAPHTH
jgi:hypothetical protein